MCCMYGSKSVICSNRFTEFVWTDLRSLCFDGKVWNFNMYFALQTALSLPRCTCLLPQSLETKEAEWERERGGARQEGSHSFSKEEVGQERTIANGRKSKRSSERCSHHSECLDRTDPQGWCQLQNKPKVHHAMYMRKTEGISQLTTGLNLTALENEVRSIDGRMNVSSSQSWLHVSLISHSDYEYLYKMMLHVSLISHSDYDYLYKDWNRQWMLRYPKRNHFSSHFQPRGNQDIVPSPLKMDPLSSLPISSSSSTAEGGRWRGGEEITKAKVKRWTLERGWRLRCSDCVCQFNFGVHVT